MRPTPSLRGCCRPATARCQRRPAPRLAFARQLASCQAVRDRTGRAPDRRGQGRRGGAGAGGPGPGGARGSGGRLMCGIIGYVGSRPAGPILLEGLKRLEYRGYDSAGLAVQENGRLTVEKRPGKIVELEDALTGRLPAGDLRDRAHALGHARTSQHGQRPSPSVARPRHRAGPQRHHRKRGKAASSLARHGIRVPQRYRHRGTGAPHRPRLPRLRPARGRGRLRAGPRRGHLRDRGDECARSREDRGCAQRQPHPPGNRHRRRVLRGLRRSRGRRAHPEGGPAARRGLGGAEPGRVPHIRSGAAGGAARRADRRVGCRDDRQGRLRPLHVQGDPRTALVAAGRDAGAAPREGRHREAGRDHGVRHGAGGHRPDHHHRMRDQLARRAHRGAHDRGASRGSP